MTTPPSSGNGDSHPKLSVASLPASPAQPLGVAKAGRSRVTRLVGWSCLTVGVLIGLVWASGPLLLRGLAEQQLSELLGRPVQVSHLSINPVSGEVGLLDLKILPVSGHEGSAAASQASADLSWRRLNINLAVWRSLWNRAAVIESLELDGLQLVLARQADARLNWQDVVDRLVGRPEEPDEGAKPAPRFVLENLRLSDACIHWHDEGRQQSHSIQGFNIHLDQLNSLDASSRQAASNLALDLQLDGAALVAQASIAPLADTQSDRQAKLKLEIRDYGLEHLLAYLPGQLGVGALSGDFTTRLQAQLGWSAGQTSLWPASTVSVRAAVGLKSLKLADNQGVQRLGLDQLELGLDELQFKGAQPGQINLDRVVVAGLQANLHRLADGRFAGLPVLDAAADPQTQPATAAPSTPTPARAGWQVHIKDWQASDWQLAWQDDWRRAGVRSLVRLEALQGKDWRWPLAENDSSPPASLKARLNLAVPAADWTLAKDVKAALQQTGQLELSLAWTGQKGTGEWNLTGLQLAPWRAYAVQAGLPWPQAEVATAGEVSWLGLPGASLPQARIQNLEIRKLRLPLAGGTPLAWETLRLEGVDVDVQAQHAQISRAALNQPRLKVQRQANGQIDWLEALGLATPGNSSASAPASAGGKANKAPQQTSPWKVALAEFKLNGAELGWRDAWQHETPVQVGLERLDLRINGASWPPVKGKAAAVSGSFRLAAPNRSTAAPGSSPTGEAPGRVSWQGRLGLAPVDWQGRVELQKLPVHDLVLLAPQALPVKLRRADFNWQGQVGFRLEASGPQLALAGGLSLDELQVRSPRDEEGVDLLAWRSLGIQELGVNWQPGAVPRVRIAGAKLSDLDARLLINEQGQLNLNDLAAPAAAASAAPAAAASAAPAASAAANASPAMAVAASSSASSTMAAGAASSGPQAAAPALDLDFGGLKLVNGQIDFTDRFIRPNYSAALSQLNGELGAYRSGTSALAPLRLDGRVAGTGQLTVQGALNPSGQPLELDVQARASDIELAPLSPYAGKYAGYAIERGKLSVDVAYRISPDGKLEAGNRLVLNQLTFGQRVESPDALGLPVTLAVALLKDRNGVIDLNLPIGGSINDPQFNVGSLVWQVLRNLIVKAVTAPFSLLFGGGEQQSNDVGFMPGSRRWLASADEQLDKLAQLLKEKPGVQLTVAGQADAQVEEDAMRMQWLEERLHSLRQRETRRESLRETASAPAAASGAAPGADVMPDMTAAERERWLAKAYADMPSAGKPRNALGLLRSLSPAETQAWLLAHAPVGTEAARELAMQRGMAVREALLARGVPLERLFLAAPQVVSTAALAAPAPSSPSAASSAVEGTAVWQPKAVLSLQAN